MNGDDCDCDCDCDCEECQADALLRAWAARDLIDLALWNAMSPLRAVEGAISALENSRRVLIYAGYGTEP